MSDLSAVKTGDRLKVDCLVTETDLTSRIWCLRVGDDDTVLIEKAALEEAAEHIPQRSTPCDWFKADDPTHPACGKSSVQHSQELDHFGITRNRYRCADHKVTVIDL